MKFLLYGIENPANLGSIIRTGAAFGVKEIYVYDEHGVLESDVALQRVKDTSMGHFKEVKIDFVEDVVKFMHGFENRFATTLGKHSRKVGDPSFNLEFPKDSLFIFGNETRGIPRKISGAEGTKKIVIPTRGMEYCLSLPVSFAIILYEFCRQNVEFFPRRGQ